jgi:hypothetical protein
MVIGGAFLLTLLAADAAINILFPPPSPDGRSTSSSRAYFEYGRSIEGKLGRLIKDTDQDSAPIARAGWISAKPETTPRRAPDRPVRLIANYGMSYSVQISEALAKIRPEVSVRTLAGPSAPPNAAYAYYLADRGKHDASVVMLAILANRVAAMESTSGINCNFEAPFPYTYPKFRADQTGELEAIEPPVRTLAELRVALQEPAQRSALIEGMSRHDSYYASYLFEKSLFDYSAIARMVRRAFAHRHERSVESLVHNDGGFVKDSATIKTLRLIIEKFAASARSDGKLPLVLLLDTRGYSSQLHDVLGDLIARDDIPYVSTNDICKASDATNYISDGHFTAAANQKLGQAVADLLDARLGKVATRADLQKHDPGEHSPNPREVDAMALAGAQMTVAK